MSESLSTAECQTRVEQFALITATDEALAQFYLQDTDWNVEAAVAAFFDKTSSLIEERLASEKRSCSNDSTPAKRQKQDGLEKYLPEKISFISWNIDGLSEKNVKQRTMAVVETIQTRKVDIVFLQEVISQTYDILKSNLSSDYLFTENKAPFGADERFYFTVIILRRSTVGLDSVLVKPFENSRMMRDLTIATAKLKNGSKLQLINTHLESSKEFSGKL